MATAPDPRRNGSEDPAAKVVMSFAWTDERGAHEVDLAFANLGAKHSRLVRQHTGMALEAFTRQIVEGVSGIGLDTLCVLWWLARMEAGERISFDVAEAGCTYATAPTITVDDGTDPQTPAPPAPLNGSVLVLPD